MNGFVFMKQGVVAKAFSLLALTALFVSLLPTVVAAATGTVTVRVMADSSVVADTAGEYVELEFTGTGSLDITGWKMMEDGGLFHTIGSFVLNSGDTYVACINTDTSLNGGITCDEDWGAESLGNSGEVVIITDSGDQIVVDTGVFDAEAGVEVEASAAYSDEDDTTDTGTTTDDGTGTTTDDGTGTSTDDGSDSDGTGTENDPYTNPQGNIDICHATGGDKYVTNSPNVSSIVDNSAHGSGQAVHDADIIPAFWHQLNGATTSSFYAGRNWDDVGMATYTHGCVATSTDDTGTSTDDGTGTTTDDGTGTSTDDGSNNDDNDVPAGACEFEGHKYNQYGNPLKNWAIGLMKIITHTNGVDTYTLDEELTDEDGYVCLTWDGEYRVPFNDETPSYVDGPYDFSYWLYERMQDGWYLNSIEMGEVGSLEVVGGDAIVYGDHLVRVQYGEDNGIILNDAAYHIDFYNFDPTATNTATSTEEETGTTTDEVAEGGGGGRSTGGSSSGTRISSRTSGQPTVSGITDTPTPMVLGEQVSAVPFGGANTGAGGASSTGFVPFLLALLAGLVVSVRRINV